MIHSIALVPFYFLGCFPTGKLVARWYGVALESQGSGNVGATNVARVIGKKAGIITLLGDVLKGALAVILARALFHDPSSAAIAGMLAVAGHCLSIPGVFKGGKGVATSLGVALVLSPLLAGIGGGIFCFVFLASRYVSLASVTALILAPIVGIFLGISEAVLTNLGICALLVVWRHKENLKRLTEGREPRFQSRKTEAHQ